MIDMSVADVPILNDYKKDFVSRRIPQTLLGGPNLYLGYSAPFYVYLTQVLLWLFPWFVGGIFTVAIEVGGLNVLIGCLLTGIIVGLFVILIQVVHLFKSSSAVQRQNEEANELTSSQQLRQFLSDDDEIFFTSLFSSTTFRFVIPPLRFPPSILIHAVFSGLLCGVGCWYTLPSVLDQLYGSSVPATVLLYIFSWISICIAQYPINAGGIPPEVATFRSLDFYDIVSLSRAFHIFIFFSFHVVEVYVSSFQTVNQVLHILFAFLPILWLTGLLPPIDALIVWLAEQFLVFGLGGSPYATDFRLLISLVTSGAVLVGSCFISNTTALTLYSAGFGFVLSTDIVSVLCSLFYKLFSLCSPSSSRAFFEQNYSSSSAHFSSFVSLLNIGWHIAAFGLLAVVSGVCSVLRDQTDSNDQVKIGFHIAFIVLFVLCKLLRDIQKVYVLFRLFRNVFYPSNFSPHEQFTSKKKRLQVCGYINMVLTTVINPLLMACYLSLFLNDPTTFFAIPSFLSGFGAVHGFRMIWQRNNGATVVFAVLSIIRLLLPSSSFSLGWFDNASLGVQLLVLDICIDRALRFIDNLWFAMSLLVTSWTDKKQRIDSSVLLLSLNVIFFPFVLAMVGLASALSAPLLSLFTLPIFYVAFPRQSRFWPQTPGSSPASLCSDTSYYAQMAPYIAKTLSRGIYLGVFSPTASDGTDPPMYLIRSQDKTFWIQTLESGYGYVSFSIKGLELQETSCHALEATRIDDACTAAFEKPDIPSSCCRTNPFPFFYAITPLDTVYVNGYSDAKNSLAGIIDYPPSIKQYHADFMKSLIWMLVHLLCEKKQKLTDIPSLEESSLASKTNSTEKSSIQAVIYKKEQDRKVAFELSPKTNGRNSIQNERQKARESTNFSSNKKSSSPSLESLASILSTDDERAVKEDRKISNIAPASHPGRVDVSEDDDWDLDSDFSDSGFGLPSKEIFSWKKSSDLKTKAETQKSVASVNQAAKNNVLVWGEIPFSSYDVNGHKKLFDKLWYLYAASGKDETSSGTEEDDLLNTCREVALACYVIAFVQGVPGKDPTSVGASHICKVFNGNIPWSPELEWLQQHKDLHKAVLRASRYAVKMMYDRVAMGTVDEADDEDHESFMTSLREYEADCLIGPETSEEWKRALRNEVSSLFSVSYDQAKDAYSARILVRRPVEAHVCKLSSSVIRSIWANLSIELLYATNDDEERYSIQAHPDLIRNLTVQAADPPLGYPIYSSSPFYEITLPLPTIETPRKKPLVI